MKRFFCAAFFIAVITLLAACGALNTTTAAAQATATPDQLYLPRPKNTVHRQGERDRRQGGGRHGPEQRHTGVHDLRCSRDPGHRGFSPLMYLVGVVGLILICSAGLLMLRKI